MDLTRDQIQTLDCGSLRLEEFPLALTAPNTTLSTLTQFFDFVDCASPNNPVLFNIESKINPDVANQTRSPADFVAAFERELTPRGAKFIDRITHQSFDWSALIESKKVLPELRTSALVSRRPLGFLASRADLACLSQCDDTTLWA